MIRMAYGWTVTSSQAGAAVFARGGFAAVAGQPDFPAVPGASAPASEAYDYAIRYYTQDAASAAAKSWNRQLQSSGVDTVYKVFGAPIGDDIANSVYTLSAGERTGKLYEFGDSLGKGLRQRLADANRIAGNANGGGYDNDVEPDVPNS